MPQQLLTPTKSSYLDTDVREVFENHTVEQVEEIHKKINYEIERKREELRMLVGERYRDLIDAADTIATMKTSSFNISQKLHGLRARFNELPSELTVPAEEGSIGRRKRKLSEEELEISLALKLSLDIPGAVQNCLEREEIIPALHLTLLFSRWLVPNEQNYKWTFLHATRGTLADTSNVMLQNVCEFCDNQLNVVETSYWRLAECILAKHILTQASVNEIVSQWVAEKVNSCRISLQKMDSEVLKIVTSTLEAIYSIFIDPDLYNNTAKSIHNYKIEPSAFGLRLIPKLLVEYNSSRLSISESLSSNTLSEIVNNGFITPLKNVLQEDANYLSQFGTLAHLQEYRQMSLKLFKEHCEDLIRIVLGPSTSLWTHVFHGVFQRRAETVGKNAVSEIIVFLRTIGYPKFKTVDGNFDIVGYVWKAIPVTNTDSAAFEDNLKMKCITPSLAQLCEDLEFRLSELLVDFQTLGDQALKEYISAEILESFSSCLQSVVEISDGVNPEKGSSAFGRFTTGLLELCPTLWKLLEKSDGSKLKQDFLSLADKCWGDWNNILVEKFNLQLLERMGSMTPDAIISFMPLGEIYEAETGESGEKFVPSVRVPVQLTYSLHALLFSICLELSKTGPQCIPKTVKDSLRITLAKNIISFYEKITESEEKHLTSQMALQFMFDLKFIQWFHSNLSGTADTVTVKLKSLIDPFDWDIVNTRMTSNLKRFLFENQLTLGLLFSEESHGFIAQNFKTKQSLTFPTPTRDLLYSQLPLLPL